MNVQTEHTLPISLALIGQEPIVIETVRDFLADLGYEVITFPLVSDLLKNSERISQSIDFILMDLDLPPKNRIEAIRATHRSYPHASIILMTTPNAILPSEVAIANGVYAYLNKPIRLGEMELLLLRIHENFGGKAR